MMKKICHVCSGHFVYDARVFQRECVTLAMNGFETHLIATSDKKEPYKEQNVFVHPLPSIKNNIQRIKRRSFVAHMAKELKPDLYHVHEPELLGPILKIAGKVPVIYDIHEAMWLTMMERDWIPIIMRPFITRLWDIRERFLIGKCAALIPATDEVAEHYVNHHNSVVTITNYPDSTEMNAILGAKRDGRTCIFAGTIAPNRGVDVAVEAIGELKKRGINVSFVIIGSGSDDFTRYLKEIIEKHGIQDRVRMLGTLPRPEVLQMLNNASIGLLPHIPSNNQIKVSIPVKLLEYMGIGLPVVYSNSPNHLKFVKLRPIGIGVDEVTPVTIADGIQWLVEHPMEAKEMGQNGKQSINEEFNWKNISTKLISLYSKILNIENSIE